MLCPPPKGLGLIANKNKNENVTRKSNVRSFWPEMRRPQDFSTISHKFDKTNNKRSLHFEAKRRIARDKKKEDIRKYLQNLDDQRIKSNMSLNQTGNEGLETEADFETLPGGDRS